MKRHPIQTWMVACSLIAAVAVALGTAGDAASTWHEILTWAHRTLQLGPDNVLLAQEKILLILALLLGAILLGFLRWVAARLTASRSDPGGYRAQGREDRTRAAYLDLLEKDVKGRLDASLHRARFIDLGLDETQGATNPWHYVHYKPDSHSIVIDSIDEAFDRFDGRLLLLGAPGAGKSTTLLYLAQRLIREARQSPGAPVPVLLNLSSYKGSTKPGRSLLGMRVAQEKTAFDEWLVRQLEALPVRGLRNFAQPWVEEGRVALLLDGLDEVAEESVSSLVRDLNESFFMRIPDLQVVICSRIFEYGRVTSNSREMRLRLQGAVTLQPLAPEQINLYLETAQAIGLRDALTEDTELQELASTPLTLSMMVLAYGGLAPTEIPTHLPLVERRRHLLDVYVHRMLQRKARRDEGKLFDLSPEEDVPLKYSLQQVNRYLGWLAVRLSERSLTSFCPVRLREFLGQELWPRRRESLWTSSRLTLIFLQLLVSTMAAAAILFLGGGSLQIAILAGVLGVLFYVLVSWSPPERFYISEIHGLIVSLVSVPPALGLAAGSSSLLLPWRPDLFWSCGFVSLLATVIVSSREAGGFSPKSIWSLSWRVMAGAGASTLVALKMMRPELVSQVPFLSWVLLLGAAGGMLFFLKFKEEKSTDSGQGFAGFLVLYIGANILFWFVRFGAWVVGEPGPEWCSVLLSFTIAFALVDGHLAWALGLSSGAVLGMAIGGAPAVTFSVLGFFLLFSAIGRKRREHLQIQAEQFLVNPCLLLILSVPLNVPIRFLRFLDYMVGSMILKRSGENVEFVHRLVRDHFAVRELISQLYGAAGEVRLGVIERLALQGESGLDPLSSLASHPDAAVRKAAVAGLTRLATPSAFPVLAEIIRSELDAAVRVKAMEGLGSFELSQIVPVLEEALGDAAPEVRAAVLKVIGSKGEPDGQEWISLLHRGLMDNDRRVFRAALMALAESGMDEGLLTEAWFEEKSRLCEKARTFLDPSFSSSVRRGSLFLVGVMRDREALPKVLTAARAAKDRSVRIAALHALGRIGGPEAVSLLESALKSRFKGIRQAAGTALGRAFSRPDPAISGPLRRAVRNKLLRALRDKAKEVQAAAAHSLTCFPDPEVVQELPHALRYGGSSEVRRAAAITLCRALSRPDLEVPEDLRTELRESLLEALKDRSGEVQAAAARSLAFFPHPGVVKALRRVLRDRRRFPEVVSAAREALEALEVP